MRFSLQPRLAILGPSDLFVPEIVPTTIQNNQINPTQSKILTGEQKGSVVAKKGLRGFGSVFSEAEGRWFESSRAYF